VTPGDRGRPPTTRRLPGPPPLYPVAIAAYFVLFLYAQNVGEVEPAEVVLPLVLAVIGAAAATALLGVVLGSLDRGAVLAALLVIVFFGYGHVANAVAPYGVPGWLQQLGWIVLVVGGALVLYRRSAPRLPTVNRAIDLVAAVLIALSLVTILPHELRAASDLTEDGRIGLTAGAQAVQPPRDVYYLIFDRYASDRELEAAFGIDGTLDDRLRDVGFYVAADSQANYVKTSLSLASSLNLTYLDEVVKAEGPASDDHEPVFEMIRDSLLARFLKSQGYRYIHVGSPYGPTDRNLLADENPRLDALSDFAGAIYDTSVLPAIARRVGLVRSTPMRERYYRAATFQWEALDRLVDAPGPKYVFCHFLLPHPPYVFAADGSFMSEDDSRDVAHNYARQLEYTDARIEALVKRLLALPEAQRPIIVLQADEGPYPARYNADTTTFDWAGASDAELAMKYGILDALYLPGVADPGLYPSITPVNSFRLILSAYFGTDTPPLPDRIFTSKSKHRPYDLTDVTDRLRR
jgi:hypothetical protein